jgi:pathogenesis-related protein 1
MDSSSRVLRWSALLLLTPLLGCGSGPRSGQREVTPQRQPVTASKEKTPIRSETPRRMESRRTGLPPEAELILDMVRAHNQARAGVKPTPKVALPRLTWSPEAAKKAAAWAKECKFEHNPNRGDFGENLAAATPNSWTTAEVVKSWADEAADYDYAKNTCKKGKVCGHYTQVVWRKTGAVGCATVMCNKNSPFGPQHPTWQNWVCNYTPPGNWVGQRPY